MKLRVFEAFAGYGSQSIALERLKTAYPSFDYEVVGFSEIDRYAVAAYYAARDPRLAGERIDRLDIKAYTPTKEITERFPNYGDITLIDWTSAEMPDFDLFTYSFPCQDISTAGKQRGFAEGSGTRSSLLWECARAIEAKRPRYLLMENVKALTFKKHADNFKRWREWLEAQGYFNYWKVLNARDFGIPQNRQRVFMVSILGEHKPFIFPETAAPKRRLRHILEQKVTDNYYLTVPQLQMIIGHCERKLSKGCGFATNFQTSQRIAGAICAGYGHYPTDTCLAEPVACAFRGRNIENPSDRSRGAKTAQRIEIGDTVANCITTVEKDSLVAEPKILGYTRDNKGVVVSRHLKEFAGSVCASNFRNTGSTAEFVAEPMVIQRSHGYAAGNVLEIAPAVTASAYTDNNFVYIGYKIRRFTPRETFRLMDLDDRYINAIQAAGISITQQRKLAGNSIVAVVLFQIFKSMFIL